MSEKNTATDCSVCPNSRLVKRTAWANYIVALAMAIAIAASVHRRVKAEEEQPVKPVHWAGVGIICLLVEVRIDKKYAQDMIDIGKQIRDLVTFN